MRPTLVALIASLVLLGTGCSFTSGSKTAEQHEPAAAPAKKVEKKAKPAADTGLEEEGEDLEE